MLKVGQAQERRYDTCQFFPSPSIGLLPLGSDLAVSNL